MLCKYFRLIMQLAKDKYCNHLKFLSKETLKKVSEA